MMVLSLDILGFYGGFPVEGSAASGYLLTSDQAKVLIDCGSGSLLKLSHLQALHDLDAVIISHLHNDHVADLLTLDHALIVAKRRGLRQHPLSLYLPEQPHTIYQRFETQQFQLHSLSSIKSFNILDLQMSVMPVRHTISAYAIKISQGNKQWAYTGDTAYFPELISFVQGTDLLLSEATVSAESKHSSGRGHMSGQEAGELAQAAKVKRLVLTHLPSDGSHQAIKQAAQNMFQGPVHLASEQSHWQI
ncbi:MBL fold metallo-hydrolase [Ignavigranum ruoffiae]|uniref:MBL fold metallo-hydrolase n=1 Tax=Ignavigranum ruoffiae TaxID=89093 RepID=UPI00205B7265|nr:MBL fold metallo-hydrolase [Ignavigranum ruoffiae]UPQ86452.1 MBL fold metallo-hydrolase [Ignavigranum ruoffiae]